MMEDNSADGDNEEAVDNDDTYRQTTLAEMADRDSMAAGEKGPQVSDDDNSIASGHASD
jgi:hypothetical protein